MSQSASQNPIEAPRKTGYIPSLDGWRALAILGVLWVHDLKATPEHLPYRVVSGSGVYLFFAISGILITTRILEEESLCGFFDIRRFYVRRIFRIQPAAWLYLAVIGCLMAAGVLHILSRHWFGALGMYENFLYGGDAYDYQGFFVGHFWTLAVEEHFYILLSLFLLLVRRNRLATLAWIFLGLLAFRVYAGLHGHLSEATWRRTYYQLPCLIYGAGFALALRKQAFRRWAEHYLKPWVVFTATAAYVAVRSLAYHFLASMPGDLSPAALLGAMNFLSAYAFAFWIVATILHPASLTTRLLEWAPLRWVGRLSYSLYLWHVLFFFREATGVTVSMPALVALSGRPAKYVAAFAAASLSYYLVEKPLMRVGHRLAPPATPGRPELAEDAARQGAASDATHAS